MGVTKHASERIRKRMGASKEGVDSIAEKALQKGLMRSEATGRLARYLDKLYFKERKCNNVRVYAQKVFVFNNKTLITVFGLPRQFFDAVAKALKRRDRQDNANEV